MPELQSAQLSLIEYLIPAGPGCLRAFMRTSKTLESGENIPVNISGVYSPLDGALDWANDAKPQVRRSQVEITESAQHNRLSLKYTTVIAPVGVPEVSTG